MVLNHKKYKLLIVLIFSLKNFFAADYSIIYVHLGENKAPAYMVDSIKQSRLFNPQAKIFVVCSQANIESIALNLESDNIYFIESSSLPISPIHSQFLNSTKLSGFWLYTLERFFYLEQVIEKFNLKNVFHMENDNLLYVDLADVLSVFTNNYKGIAVTFDSDYRGIGGFMYIKDSLSLLRLNQYSLSEVSKSYNDMQLLSFFKQDNPNYIDSLPIVPKLYLSYYELINSKNETVQNKEVYINNFNLFNSVFDAAALGQFIGGIDPIHANSQPGFINETCVFNPSHFKYEWEHDHKNRKVPFINFKGKKYRINNLHIHCKNLKKFIS